MTLNPKPILIGQFNIILRSARGPLSRIERISKGHIGTPEQIEDIELYYSDGTVEKFSILEMDASETLMAICEAVVKHG